MKTASLKREQAGLSPAAADNELLLREGAKIVQALGRMFAPSCEVVLHDLQRPENAILAIENPLSGRQVGEPTTEMGLARVKDPMFQDVVQNYPNTFPDGRAAKSTSIGLRNSEGVCIAAICLNLDISMFDTMQRVLEQFSRTESGVAPVQESFRSHSLDAVREAVLQFAAKVNVSPRALTVHQRRELIAELTASGMLHTRGAFRVVSETLGIARSSVYNALKPAPSLDGGEAA